MTTQELQDTIETLIDQTSLLSVMNAIVAVCYEKGEHLRSNWQDYNAAQTWDRNAKKIDATAGKLQY